MEGRYGVEGGAAQVVARFTDEPASLTARLLPFAEWGRLAPTSLVALAALPAEPPDLLVVVVEDAGRIVACWSAFSATLLEGLWRDPDHAGVRKRTEFPSAPPTHSFRHFTPQSRRSEQ